MKIEIMSGTVVLHEIAESRIERAEWSGKKLVAEDYFMNEPSSVRLSLVIDTWLWEKLESEIVKIKDGLWLRYPVRVYDSGIVSSAQSLVLTGLISLTESAVKPVERRMEIVIYDYSALLSELDVKVRIYYAISQSSDVLNSLSYIINYQLPGEGENEPPEDDDESDNAPLWFPYLHTIETSDAQVSSILQALTQIWRECFQENWVLSFNHSYESEGSGGTEVNNYVVKLRGADSFYWWLVLGVAQEAYSALRQQIGAEHWLFYVNHGFVKSTDKEEITREFGLSVPEAEGYFVIRAGYSYCGDGGIGNPEGWSGGYGTVADGPYQYRVHILLKKATLSDQVEPVLSDLLSHSMFLLRATWLISIVCR